MAFLMFSRYSLVAKGVAAAVTECYYVTFVIGVATVAAVVPTTS